MPFNTLSPWLAPTTTPTNPHLPIPLTFATDLNQHYTRFDRKDVSDDCPLLLSDTQVDSGSVTITEADVRHQFQRIKTSKAAGRLLRDCADSLSPVFQPIFQRVDSVTVPTLWETAIIVQIPKKPKPTELNHYRPVALTPLAFAVRSG